LACKTKGQGCQLGMLHIWHHRRTNEKSQEACATTNTCTTKASTSAIFYKYNSQTSQDHFSKVEDTNCYVVEELKHMKVYLPKQLFTLLRNC
jgi:hypothetical protein